MKNFRLFVLMFLAVSVLAACSLAEDITPPPNAQSPSSGPQGQSMGATSPMSGSSAIVYPVVAPDPAKGAALYAEKCAPCHGDSGLGDGPKAAQLSVPVAAIGDPAKARQASPAAWFNIVTNGNIERFMPPFINGLTDRERWDVVAYALNLSAPQNMVDTGKELYTANCAECHGDTGLGDGPKAAAQPRSFHDLEFMANQSGQALFDAITNGVADQMQSYSQLSEDERWALVAYVRSLTYAAPGVSAVEAANTPQETAVTSAITTTAGVTSTSGVVNVSINLPEGMSLPDDAQVILYVFDNMSLAFTTTNSTRSDLVFSFNDIGMPAERAFIASADFNGVTYGSDVAVPNETGVINLDVPVYENSTDTSVLVIDRLHMFFDFSVPGTVQVVEVYVVTNPTEKTVVPLESGSPVLTFMVPDNAENLQFQDGVLGGKYLQMPGGFGDTTPVRAGETGYQVMFAYDLPYTDGVKFDQIVNYNVNSSIILVPDNGVTLKSDKLQEGTAQAIQGANYKVYNGEALTAGSTMSLELSGKPSAAGAPTTGGLTDQNSLLIGLGALGLVLILAGVWLWRRERRSVENLEDEDLDEEQTEDDLDDAESLMDAIIALDDSFKSGQISEEAYQQRRAELKSRLQKRLD